MIGKIMIGKSFRGCISYCLEDKVQAVNEPAVRDRSELLDYNLCFGEKNELIRQFNEVRNLNNKLAKPVLHITLSLSINDHVNKEILVRMTEDCAKELGFNNNQYIAVMHKDTKHQHLHLVVNRVGFDGRTLSDSNNYQKIANYCRKMEDKYSLEKVLNPRRFMRQEHKSLPRFDQRKERLRTHIDECLRKSQNYQQFEQLMKAKGYKTEKGRGVAFIDDKKVRTKGSEVGYSLSVIERSLALAADRNTLLEKNRSSKEHQNTHPLQILKKNTTKTKPSTSLTRNIPQQPEGTAHELLPKKRKKKGKLNL